MGVSASRRFTDSAAALPTDISSEQHSILAEIIKDNFGIDLPESKKGLIPGRLNKRLRQLQFSDYSQYIAYLKQNWDSEKQVLANAVTTNLTSFFRESHHFNYLAEVVIPELIEKKRSDRKLRIWSAACSTGEEPYSIAMVVKAIPELKNWDVKILATDLDTNILQTAYDGIYTQDRFSNVDSRYFDKSWFSLNDENRSTYEISEELKKLILYKKLNFLEPWPMKGMFDVIFCRNVLIYFDEALQTRIVSEFANYQSNSGFLLIGHSESLGGNANDYELVSKTIYKKYSYLLIRLEINKMQSLPLCLPQFNNIKRFKNNKLDVACIAKIMPGEYYVTRHNEVLTTVLGSCISVCVYDAKKSIGGMNHFMLPSDSAESNVDSCTLNDSTRYGNYAMEVLINDILYNGGSRKDLRFKVFGGGNIMDARFDVGQQNIAFVRSFIENEGYRIESEDVGSNCPRRINFYPVTGKVKVKRLPRAASSEVVQAERSIDTQIRPPSNSGDLELF